MSAWVVLPPPGRSDHAPGARAAGFGAVRGQRPGMSNSPNGRTRTTRARRHGSGGTARSCARRWRPRGFVVYPYEWWHFDYQGGRYPIMNVRFDEIRSMTVARGSDE